MMQLSSSLPYNKPFCFRKPHKKQVIEDGHKNTEVAILEIKSRFDMSSTLVAKYSQRGRTLRTHKHSQARV
ncbi:uncharacterized protein RAG0_11095 [Rhynchosporium agropyri]|uniref:Uncharacterized protein n=1 Tax=Rhynchosporium agropyri TaxID=914238 RepID=A0A1E1L2P0_9HELO|nr:uncharacterized protein RAG0_11095 [Rhynchosporium agropyri]